MAKKTTREFESGATSSLEIPSSLIDSVRRRIAANQRVRRTLPLKGRLHIDRQLPFLCVYRQPPDREDAGTERLVKGEASYLIVAGETSLQQSASDLVQAIASTLAAEFGAFLVVEVWSTPDGGNANDPADHTVLPTFTIHTPATSAMTRTVDALAKHLKRVKVLKLGVEVEVVRDDKCHPPEMRPLLTKAQASELNCSFVGLAVPPVYRKADSTEEFPLLARALLRKVGLALRQADYEFARSRTTHRPPHYHALGRKAVVKSVWDIDQKLADVSNKFDYLLQLTPVNTRSAWDQFQSEQFERVPAFHYRPLPIDPAILKRELYSIPIERVEDPALQKLFQEKREELELKLTMLRDRDTPRFLSESLQLFGGVHDDLLQLAGGLLNNLEGPVQQREGLKLNAEEFAKQAETEFEYYRQACPEFKAKTLVSADVSGLIVSRGKLLINVDLSLPTSRVKALLAHEIGTHLLTYYNGRQQPFQQLYSGLAGYEELQEGLAVLAESLVGGLTRSRMRQLAARVVAVKQLTDGATFVDVFRTLVREYDFDQRAAFNITMRVYRGGGLTKDAIYLRGFERILRYVQKGGDLTPLFVGKMAVEHIPIIKELQHRMVLKPVSIIPRYLHESAAVERLNRLRGSSVSVADLVSHTPSESGGAP